MERDVCLRNISEASRTLIDDRIGGECRSLPLKTLDRMVERSLERSRGFGHRVGGPPSKALSTTKFSCPQRSSTPTKTTLAPALFQCRAKNLLTSAIDRYGDAEGGGFFDRPSDAAPWAASTSAASPSGFAHAQRNSVAAIASHSHARFHRR